jgi:hypothetical protein
MLPFMVMHVYKCFFYKRDEGLINKNFFLQYGILFLKINEKALWSGKQCYYIIDVGMKMWRF